MKILEHNVAADDCLRERALENDGYLLEYVQKWAAAVERLQRSRPAQWRVAGLSDEEVRDSITLRLLEILRLQPPGFRELGRPGMAWGLAVAKSELSALRARFRVRIEPTDFAHVALPSRAATQEEQWLEEESASCRTVAADRARRGLSRLQRRWLAALELSAQRGESFEHGARVNVSAASRALGRHRSSGQRIYQQLCVRYRRELVRVEQGVR
jgi:hypothetical protein